MCTQQDPLSSQLEVRDDKQFEFCNMEASGHQNLGWWAVGLAAAYILMMFLNSSVFMRLPVEVAWRQTILPFYGIFMILCGLASGVVGLVAVLRKHERSWLVWLSLFIGISVLFFVLGEFLIPH